MTAETFGRMEEVAEWVAKAQDVVAQPSEPAVAVGPQCYEPFECGFCAYCSPPAPPTEFPLEWLPNLSARKRDLFAEQGIDDMSGAPDPLLSERQRRVKECTLERTVFFDASGAAGDLAGYGFPVYFLDFETVYFAVPIWKGTRPYQQVVFQFSVHVVPEAGGEEHKEFLDLSGNDPSEPLAIALIEAAEGVGPIFAYNAGLKKRGYGNSPNGCRSFPLPCTRCTHGSSISCRLRGLAIIIRVSKEAGASKTCCPPLPRIFATTASVVCRMAAWRWRHFSRRWLQRPAQNGKSRSNASFWSIATWILLPWFEFGKFLEANLFVADSCGRVLSET